MSMTWEELRQLRDAVYAEVHLSEMQSRLRKDIAIRLGHTDVQVVVTPTGRRGRLVAFTHDANAVIARPDGLAFRETVNFDDLEAA